MTTIPEVRFRLRQLAKILKCPELDELAAALIRRRPRKKAENKSTPMTIKLRADIRRYCKANPDLSQQEVATHFGVNAGRVSEALRGKKT